MRISKATSEIRPQNTIEQLSANRFSCRVCADIIETDDGFNFTSYRDSFNASSYPELLVNIIHTRYTYDDENNFINDYIAEGMTKNIKATVILLLGLSPKQNLILRRINLCL